MACALALAAAACGGLSDEEAVNVVRVYDRQVIAAFRAGDPQLIEGVAGDREARKLWALIGVKLDQNIFLDAELEDLRVTGVERASPAVLVDTEERWTYRDRRIGSGALVGQESRDRYRMRYTLRKVKGVWVVDATEFRSSPEVGRPAGPPLDARAAHGTVISPPPEGAAAR
jgi:hypothetical protein